MAHVAGPALTQEGADDKQTMREDTEKYAEGEDGSRNRESQHTQE